MYSHATSIITPSSNEKGELPSDVLVELPILRGDGGEGMGGVDTGCSFGDVDLNMDAEIDMALCMSIEEERVLPAAAASSEEAKTGEDRGCSPKLPQKKIVFTREHTSQGWRGEVRRIQKRKRRFLP